MIMAYTKRFDGRQFDELRPMEAKVGIIPRADGSAMFKIGKTIAFAAVYGPRELHPKFMQNPNGGVLRCNYNMMPFSGHGNRVRPGTSRRSKEISMVTENAISPVVNLKDYPNAVVDVFIELPQTDAGTRCAGINAAIMALADAGIEMKDLVCAVAVGWVGDRGVVDLNYDEEAYEDGAADMPIGMMAGSKQITLLQMDGEIPKHELPGLFDKAKGAVDKIADVMRTALKEKYGGNGQ